MKKLLFTLVALFAIASAQAQEAFYIYQNDGHFDGFFYDEVEKISYSKLDTLDVEHDDYVSQEIITADSTYRIMLTAIDSVGFVQPEVKLNPQLKDVQQRGMLDYLISKDLETLTFVFSTAMPETLRPKVGDVLANYNPDDGWGGKVRTVTVLASGILVECDQLTSLKDIFERFIAVEEYTEDAVGRLLSRRVAGMPQLSIGDAASARGPRRADHSVEFDFFNFSVNGHYPVYVSPSGDGSITVDAATSVATSVKAVWNFDEQNYFSVATTFDAAAKLGFTADYKFKDIFPANLDQIGTLYIPTVAPVFYVKLTPDLFFRGDCHVNLSMATPELRGKFWVKVECIDDFTSPYVYFKKLKPRDEEEQKEEDESNRWSGAVEFNGFVQMGVKEEFAFGTNKIISWFVDGKVGATTYIGPKLSGALNLSFSNAWQDQLSVYNVAKDTKLEFKPLAVDYESTATVKTLFSGRKEVTLAEGSLDLLPGLNGVEIYAFPEFSLDIEKGEDEAGNATVTATVKPSRNLIWPVDYGAGIFNEENEMVDYCWGTEIGVQMYGMFEKLYPEKEKFVHTFTVTTPGKYTVRPIFKVGGCDIVAAPEKEFVVKQKPGSGRIKGIRRACIGWSDIPTTRSDNALSSSSGTAPYLGYGPVTGTCTVSENMIQFSSHGQKEIVKDTIEIDRDLYGDIDLTELNTDDTKVLNGVNLKRIARHDKWSFDIYFDVKTETISGNVKVEYTDNSYMNNLALTPSMRIYSQESFSFDGVPLKGMYRFGNEWMGTAIDTEMYKADEGSPLNYISKFVEKTQQDGSWFYTPVEYSYSLRNPNENDSPWSLCIYIEPEY